MPTIAEIEGLHAAHYQKMLGAIFDIYKLSGILGAGIFDLNRENVLGGWSWAIAHSAEGIDATSLCISFAFDRIELLMLRVEPSQLVQGLRSAVACARRNNDEKTLGRLLRDLGTAQSLNDEFEPSLASYRQSKDVCHRAGDSEGEARALSSLGTAHLQLNDVEAAHDYFARSLQAFREISGVAGEAEALNGLGAAQLALGWQGQAAQSFEEALTLYRRLDNYRGEANALFGLADARSALDQQREAAELYAEALVIFRQLNDRRGETQVLNSIWRFA